MKSLVEKIDKLIEEKSLLKHPFYVTWSEGKLSLEALAGYSKEYYHLVKAVPSFVDSIVHYCPTEVREEVVAIRDDEINHINPWIKFAESLKIGKDSLIREKPFKETQTAVEEIFTLMNGYLNGATAMYALEQEIPKVSETKLDGLNRFYGIISPEAQEYFKIHMESDIEHADTWRKILEKSDPELEEKLFAIAENAVNSHSKILDVCYENFCN